MITRTAPWDKNNHLPVPSAQMRAMEQAIVEWVTELLRYESRGYITHGEFVQLVRKGPGLGTTKESA